MSNPMNSASLLSTPNWLASWVATSRGSGSGVSAPVQPGRSPTAAASAMRARPSGVAWAVCSASMSLPASANGSPSDVSWMPASGASSVRVTKSTSR